MVILAIDPGSRESGVVVWNARAGEVISCEHFDNFKVLADVRNFQTRAAVVAIEQIRGYGIVAGDDTFDTCAWVGRFQEAYERNDGKVHLIPRKEIKRQLCGNTTTNDKYIRQALIDRIGDVGSKRQPGPLFGISGHLWAALAVAVVCADQIKAAEDEKVVRECGL